MGRFLSSSPSTNSQTGCTSCPGGGRTRVSRSRASSNGRSAPRAWRSSSDGISGSSTPAARSDSISLLDQTYGGGIGPAASCHHVTSSNGSTTAAGFVTQGKAPACASSNGLPLPRPLACATSLSSISGPMRSSPWAIKACSARRSADAWACPACQAARRARSSSSSRLLKNVAIRSARSSAADSGALSAGSNRSCAIQKATSVITRAPRSPRSTAISSRRSCHPLPPMPGASASRSAIRRRANGWIGCSG
jgi:hypothetical protein